MDPTGDRKFGHIALAVDHVRMPVAIPSPTHWSPPRASTMHVYAAESSPLTRFTRRARL
jgi:hypothetical protein